MASTAAAAKTPVVDAAPASAPAKRKSKLLVIIIALSVVLAAAGAGAWFFLSNETDEEEPKVSSKPAVFLPVDQFTVNLQPEDGQQQYLQVAMTLKVVDQAVSDSIKALMPEVRSRVLLLLSNKKPSQLLALEVKNKLIAEIAQEVETSLGVDKHAKPAKKKSDGEAKKVKGKAKAKPQEAAVAAESSAPSRVLAVYFTHFIVQ